MGHRSFSRADRLAPIVRNAVGEALVTRVRDPRLQGVSVTDVRVAPDLRLARVYVHSMLDDPDADAIIEAMEAAVSVFRREIGEKAKLRYMPDLFFHYDEGIDRALRVESILAGLDIPPAEQPSPDEDDTNARD